MSEKGLLTVQETADAVGGRLLYSSDKNIYSVSIDSRTVNAGSVFFALKGENLDGHDFINDAVSRGAVCVVAEKESEELRALAETGKCAVIVKENTLKALQALAGYYRSRFKNIFMIGVTGSSGKTTVKDLIASILELEGPTVKNRGNLNSETGLPLSIFNIKDNHKFGVFELGINHPGEMDDIAGILKPDFAVLTNIGTAHIGNFGSKEVIAAEKIKIFKAGDNLRAGIIWEDDQFAGYVKKEIGNKIGFYGIKNTEGLLSAENCGLDGSILNFSSYKVKFPLIGKHNLNNALAAVSAAGFFNISPDKIKTALEKASPIFGRGQILPGKITVINDCYNSNLESVSSAVNFLDQLEWKGRKILVLGSILELGGESERIHSEVLKIAAAGNPDAVFLYGSEFESAWNGWKNRNKDRSSSYICWSENPDVILGKIVSYIAHEDIVLLKGSRGMALESFIDPILKIERKVVNC